MKKLEKRGIFFLNITFDYNFDSDLQMMPIVRNSEYFNKWLRIYPFYNNVKKGVELYAA